MVSVGRKWGSIVLLVVVLLLGYALFKHQYGVPGDSPFDRFAAEPLIMDFDGLNTEQDVAAIKSTFHRLKLTCVSEPSSPLGDYVCWAPISAFNGIDAKIAAFFFRNGKLSTVRLSFTDDHHPQLFSQMHVKYGPVRMIKSHGDSYGNNIVGWVRPSGLVVINDHVEVKQEAIILWISGERILEQLFGSRLPAQAPSKNSL